MIFGLIMLPIPCAVEKFVMVLSHHFHSKKNETEAVKILQYLYLKKTKTNIYIFCVNKMKAFMTIKTFCILKLMHFSPQMLITIMQKNVILII